MPRLVRPDPPLAVRLAVALKQIGWSPWEAIELRVAAAKEARELGRELDDWLAMLAVFLRCEWSDLRLDHDPALENREKVFRKGVHVDYIPAANDPDYLFYRPHGTEFAGSHDVKTRIRGDHGQLSDNALAKKERRRLRKIAQKNAPRGKKLRGPKLRSANRWPPNGSRKIQNRGFR